jgi:hypothetical protein
LIDKLKEDNQNKAKTNESGEKGGTLKKETKKESSSVKDDYYSQVERELSNRKAYEPMSTVNRAH